MAPAFVLVGEKPDPFSSTPPEKKKHFGLQRTSLRIGHSLRNPRFFLLNLGLYCVGMPAVRSTHTVGFPYFWRWRISGRCVSPVRHVSRPTTHLLSFAAPPQILFFVRYTFFVSCVDFVFSSLFFLWPVSLSTEYVFSTRCALLLLLLLTYVLSYDSTLVHNFWCLLSCVTSSLFSHHFPQFLCLFCLVALVTCAFRKHFFACRII